MYQGEKIVIHISRQHDLFLLQARRKSPVDRLTPAEQAVTRQLIKGLSNKEIGRELGNSAKTVDNHLQQIYKKLGLPNRKRVIAVLKGT